MALDIVVCFYLLGLFAGLVRSDLRLPASLYDTLTLLLLLTIGLKGGVELSRHSIDGFGWQVLALVGLGAILALMAFQILLRFGRFDRNDAACIGAHYGSVSVGTFAVAIAFLDHTGVLYEPHAAVFVVIMEMPAIAIGILLARGLCRKTQWGVLAHEVFLNKGMLLMGGGLLIGATMGDAGTKSIHPLFFESFKGVLALFLLEMGLVTAERMGDLKKCGLFLLGFGVGMPLLGAVCGAFTGHWLGLSVGGVALLATLAASASYIAVPAAMRIAVPQARHGIAIAVSLGVTFPFNVAIGIPLYLQLARHVTAL